MELCPQLLHRNQPSARMIIGPESVPESAVGIMDDGLIEQMIPLPDLRMSRSTHECRDLRNISWSADYAGDGQLNGS